MSDSSDDEPEVTDAIQLISDGENVVVLGDDHRGVERFLRSKGLLDQAREFGRRELAPVLRSSGDTLKTISDTLAESSLWLRLTPESAEAISEFGLTESQVSGVAYAMAGRPGDIKEWLKVDTSWRANATNPGFLSGASSLLSQAAREHEASQLREFLASVDQKLDQILRGQQDEIIGDLVGVERQIRVTRRRVDVEGGVDSLTWSMLFGTSVELRQVQAKALLKLGGIALDLEGHRRFGDLNERLEEAKGEVAQWLAVISRSALALDDLAVLHLDYLATLEPDRLEVRRATLAAERQEDRAELEQGVAGLLERMNETAQTVNQNKLLHVRGVPKALNSIEEIRRQIQRVLGAFGITSDWESLEPVRLREALLQSAQWKKGLAEGSSLAWEKGKPVAATLGVVAVPTVVRVATKGKIKLKP